MLLPIMPRIVELVVSIQFLLILTRQHTSPDLIENAPIECESQLYMLNNYIRIATHIHNYAKWVTEHAYEINMTGDRFKKSQTHMNPRKRILTTNQLKIIDMYSTIPSLGIWNESRTMKMDSNNVQVRLTVRQNDLTNNYPNIVTMKLKSINGSSKWPN